MRDGERKSPDPPSVQVFALGGFRVVIAGRVLADSDWRRRTARQLFKCLLSRPNRRMTRDEVIELLWPESDPEAAATNLRSTLHAMRRTLEPSQPAAAIGMVYADRDSVWLRPDIELWVDADAFERTLQQARGSTDPVPLLEQASAMYAGMYLPDDVYEDWASERRERLKQTWAQLQIRLSQELEQRGDAEAAAQHLQRLLQADPCDEHAAQATIQLLARHGHRSEALRTYQRLVQALSDELGVEPSDASVAIHRQIASGEPGLVATTTFLCTYPFPAPRDLIGREAEVALLERLLASGKTTGQAAMIGAPAGTGKSALLGQLVKRAQARGVLCLAGGCYEDRGSLPLGPFHDALADYLLDQPAERVRTLLGGSVGDLVQVVPELRYHLKIADTAPETAPTIDRMRAFGAIHACLRGLTERGPVLLCIEDLHAADEATLQLFHYLARQTRRLPLVIVATYRSDEAPADQALAQTAAAMARERLALRVTLNSLGRADTERLATALLEGSPSQALGESVYTTTGGNPLFVEQLLFALGEAGQLERKAGVWHGTTALRGTPQIVREVIAQRLLRLPASCRDVLAMASVLGQSFDHKVLMAALDPVDEQTLLRDVDRAIDAHVLQETPAGYAFGHGLLREAVYWDLSSPRRMLLHARAGDLLERFRGQQADDNAAELAYHFMLAGESSQVRAKALHYNLQAGKRAAQLSSYPESLAHFERACEILERDNTLANVDIQVEGLSGRGFAESSMARYPESVASYRKALALSNDPIQRGRARKVIAFSLAHTPAFRELIEECEAGLAEVKDIEGPDATEIRATLHQLTALAWYLQGRYGEVLRLGRRIEREAVNAGPGPRMLAHWVIGWGFMGQGQVDQATEQYELAIAEAEQWGDKPHLASAYETLGLQDYLAGRFAAAREHLGRALALFQESASALRGANALNLLCRVWAADGEHRRASEQILLALQLEVDGQERWAADAHHVLGVIQTLRSEWDSAGESFGQALRIRKQAGDVAGAVEETLALGLVDQCVGRWDQAASRYLDAMESSESMDPSPIRVHALRCSGRLRLLTGDMDGARVEIEQALDLAETMSGTLEYGPTLLAMAELRAREGRFDRAHDAAMRALDHTRPLDQLVEAHVALAQICLAMNDATAANNHAAEAASHATRLGSPRLLSLSELVSAQTAARAEPERATAAFESALRHSAEAASPYERWMILGAYAHYLRGAGANLELAASLEAELLEIAADVRVSIFDPAQKRTVQLLPATT